MDAFETTALWWYLKMENSNKKSETIFMDEIHFLPWCWRGPRAKCPCPRLFNATESEEVI